MARPNKKIIKWKRVGSKTLVSNQYVKFIVDDVIAHNGERLKYFLTNKNHTAVFVLPIDSRGRLMILKEYRYPVNKMIYGPIAGNVDAKETPLAAAKRELKEEAGYTAQRYTRLGKFYASPAKSNGIFYAYAAEGLAAGESTPDDTEVLEPVFLPAKKIEKMIVQGKVLDPYLLDMYLLYKLRLAKK